MGGAFTGSPERLLKGGSGNETSLAMGARLGKLEGGGLLLRALKVMKGKLWGWASLFMGAQLGKLEWARRRGALRDGRRVSGDGVPLSEEAPWRGPRVGAPSLGTLCRKCSTEEKTSVDIWCECEALASFRHTYLSSFLF